MAVPKKNLQEDMQEKKITNKKAREAVEAIVEADKALEALPKKEIAEWTKKRKDARAALLEALPVTEDEAIYRVDDYVVRVSPAAESHKVEFILRPKPRLSFVNPDESE